MDTADQDSTRPPGAAEPAKHAPRNVKRAVSGPRTIGAILGLVAFVVVFGSELPPWLFPGINPFARRAAIELVQNSPAPSRNMVMAFRAAANGSKLGGTWQSYLQAGVTARGESLDDYEWFAKEDVSGLRPGEWYVGFMDKSNTGHFFVANTDTNKVIHVNTDMLTAHRIGHLQEESRPHLQLTVQQAGFERCESFSNQGWCWAIEGAATNSGDPIVGVDAEVEIVLQTGGKTIKGESVDRSPDPFRRTTASRPWPVGETRSFKYRSRIIPEVYASAGVRGQGIVVFSTAVETVTQSRVSEDLVVKSFSWPDVLGNALHASAARQ
jgi:hypothetical protein